MPNTPRFYCKKGHASLALVIQKKGTGIGKWRYCPICDEFFNTSIGDSASESESELAMKDNRRVAPKRGVMRQAGHKPSPSIGSEIK